MNWVWDQTHRFRMRPEYSAEELDAHCETILVNHFQKRLGAVTFPVATRDLKGLLESEVHSLELHADLKREPGEIESVVEFRRGRKPSVKISAKLSEAPLLENRLRAALMHVYGHVRFHDFVFQSEEGSYLSLFEGVAEPLPKSNRCTRESIQPLDERDWMEWQAGFVAGALLMPAGPLIEQVREFRRVRDLDLAALSDRSLDGAALVEEVAQRFQVAPEAARVRLLQHRIIASSDTGSLF
jgi:hypothetical protein